jgi:hypothetical protein
MVHQGDFDISLVHADTKFLFKEHTNDGKENVEVEPGEVCSTRRKCRPWDAISIFLRRWEESWLQSDIHENL